MTALHAQLMSLNVAASATADVALMEDDSILSQTGYWLTHGRSGYIKIIIKVMPDC